jgi:peptidoglycan/xylan/chitin deacetylase (PgdA/CDA1 family)
MIRRGIERLGRAARWPRRSRPPEGRVLILIYHQINRLLSDPWGLAVKPRHFAQHLEVLQRHARVIPLQRLSQALLDGNLPDRSVVVTFDDGYADNLYNAKPLLERYDVPATVFLTAGYIGRERELWWDELDRILLQPGALPETLCLRVNGDTYRWELGEAAHYSEDASLGYRRWRAWRDTPSPRHHLYRSLWDLLNPLSEAEQRKALDELLTWAGAEPTVRPTHRFLSLEEVVALAQGDLIEIGAHTVTHPVLSALPAASQRVEIQRSKARLEEVLKRPVTNFSYPYGNEYHYTAETVGMVKEAGFTSACSSFAGVVEQTTDPFQLPRVRVPDCDGERLARRLSRWFSN